MSENGIKSEYIIIGAGIAGLNLARQFTENNINFVLIEKNSYFGGKVYSEYIDDFILDHGFQIFLDNYKMSKKVFHLPDLNLKKFYSGGMFIKDNKFELFANPIFHFLSKNNKIWLETPGIIGTYLKHLISKRKTIPTQDWINNDFKTSELFKRFTESFLRGVLLEPKLQIDKSIAIEFLKLFAFGHATIPQNGMYELPKQLYSKIKNNNIIFNEEVISIKNNKVVTKSGNSYTADKIILAANLNSVNSIFNLNINNVERKVTNIYFKTSEDFLDFPGIYLNGKRNGIINNFCMPSLISENYSPKNQNLLSISLFDSKSNYKDTVNLVLNELKEWFGPIVNTMELIKIDDYFNDNIIFDTYHLKQSIKNNYKSNVFLCGGYLVDSSIEGAVLSSNKLADYLVKN
ncbi:MAG: FAD-dependent oxidoreductase [Dehalococcoidia bacterium]